MRILKGLVKRGPVKTAWACVYPSDIIHEVEIKSREKLQFAGPKAAHVLPRGGLALLGDYANVFDARLTNLVGDLSSVAVLGASIHLEVDLPL